MVEEFKRITPLLVAFVPTPNEAVDEDGVIILLVPVVAVIVPQDIAPVAPMMDVVAVPVDVLKYRSAGDPVGARGCNVKFLVKVEREPTFRLLLN